MRRRSRRQTDPVTVTATPNTQLDADICAALGGAQF